MPEFLYKAQNSQGNNFEGTLEAKDKAEAEALLLRRRLVITSLKKKPTEIKLKIGSGIKTEDITRFTRMFGAAFVNNFRGVVMRLISVER